jgi:hypothetical protein
MAEWFTALIMLAASSARTELVLAAALARDQAGIATAANIAATAMTTSASNSVNPSSVRCTA